MMILVFTVVDATVIVFFTPPHFLCASVFPIVLKCVSVFQYTPPHRVCVFSGSS